MSAPRWTAADLPDLTGQTWLITGPTNGIGRETARAASDHGARVILAARDTGRAHELGRSLPGAYAAVQLDLASMASVRAAAESVTDEIDVLVNNAGAFTKTRQETADGFEMDLGVNFLGPFLLTRLLLPQVRRRVVIVGSDAHRMGRFDLDDPNFTRRRWQMAAAYAQSKLADMLWGAELSRRLVAEGGQRDAQLAHPGWALTNLQNVSGPRMNKAVTAISSLFAQSAEMGALPTLCAATADLEPGSYVGPDGFQAMRGYPKLLTPSPAAADPELAADVWAYAESVTEG